MMASFCAFAILKPTVLVTSKIRKSPPQTSASAMPDASASGMQDLKPMAYA
jgi:hypothetical protein